MADYCRLPDDRLYDVERDIWFKALSGQRYRVGVAHPLCFLTGFFTEVRPRPEKTLVHKGAVLALLVSSRYEGALTAPADLTILENNPLVTENPRLVCEDPYGLGWVSDVQIMGSELPAGLKEAEEAGILYDEKNRRYGVVCLKAVPHYTTRIFSESCTTILSEVSDFMEKHLSVGELLHVVTRDPATEVDMMRWASETGHELVDLKRQGEVLHALFRKADGIKPSTTQTTNR